MVVCMCMVVCMGMVVCMWMVLLLRFVIQALIHHRARCATCRCCQRITSGVDDQSAIIKKTPSHRSFYAPRGISIRNDTTAAAWSRTVEAKHGHYS